MDKGLRIVAIPGADWKLTRDRSMQMLNLIMKSIFILFYLQVCYGSLLLLQSVDVLREKRKTVSRTYAQLYYEAGARRKRNRD
jgi:hypothetical protein